MNGMVRKLDQLNTQRPAYTKYELSKLVKDKRKTIGMSIEAFSFYTAIDSNILIDIESATRSFNVKMMKSCSKILGLTIEELTKQDSESLESYSFRSDAVDSVVNELVLAVDSLFNEIVMQKKLSA